MIGNLGSQKEEAEDNQLKQDGGFFATLKSNSEVTKRSNYKRERQYALGVIFGFCSKASGALNQVISIPIAVSILGVDSYAVFATLVAVATWPALFVVHFGPRLIATVARGGEANKQRFMFRQAASHLIINIAIVATISLATLIYVPILERFPSVEATIGNSRGAQILLVLIAIQLMNQLLAVPEAFQIGFQEHHFLSVVTLLSNITSVILVISILWVQPTLECFASLLFLPLIVARTLNAIHFIHRYELYRNPTTAPSTDVGGFRQLRDAFAYTVVAGFGAYLTNQSPLLLLAIFNSDQNQATYASITALAGALMQPAMLLISPLVPTIASSIEKKETRWAANAVKRLFAILTVYGVFIVVTLSFFGPSIYTLWLKSLDASSTLMMLVGLYIAVSCIETCLFTLSHIVGNLRFCYMVYALRVAATVVCAFYSSLRENPLEAYFGFTVTIISLITVVPIALNLRRKFLELAA